MQPLDLVNRVVNRLAPYLPKAAEAGVAPGQAGDARALYVAIERAVCLHHQEQALDNFVEDPYGRGGSGLKQALHQILEADPTLATVLGAKLDALAGQAQTPAPEFVPAGVDPITDHTLPTGAAQPGPSYLPPGPVGAPAWPAAYPPPPYPVAAYPPPPYAIAAYPPYGAVAYPGAPATIGDRFVARLIDSGLLIGVLVVFGLCNNAVEQSAHPLSVLLSIAALAVLFGYEFYAVGRYGKTIGKHVMKLQIVKVSGGPPGWGAAAGRSFIPMLANCTTCGMVGNLFYLSPLFDSGPYKRGWHDQVASTVVIRAI